MNFPKIGAGSIRKVNGAGLSKGAKITDWIVTKEGDVVLLMQSSGEDLQIRITCDDLSTMLNSALGVKRVSGKAVDDELEDGA